MDICFTNIQNLLLLENHPLYTIDEPTNHVIKKFYKDSFIMKNILLMKKLGFNIQKNVDLQKDFHIEGVLLYEA